MLPAKTLTPCDSQPNPDSGCISSIRREVVWGQTILHGLIDGVEQNLFAYYRDELTFTDGELIGLTAEQASSLRHEKDVRYLRG